MIITRHVGAYIRRRGSWEPVTWGPVADYPVHDGRADLVATDPPRYLPPPTLGREQLAAAIATTVGLDLLRYPDWSGTVVAIATACHLSYAQACTVARACGRQPQPEHRRMPIIVPDCAWLREQREAIRVALARQDIRTASRIADAVLAYIGKGSAC